MGVVQLGVAEKILINEKGYSYTKRRVTHERCFPGPSGMYINNRVLRDTLQPCFSEFCFLLILHIMSDMRLKWPSKCILIRKIDVYAVYCQIHANLQITSSCIEIVGILEFLCLGLPFGTTPALEYYTAISKSETDIGNDLLVVTSWDAS